MADLFTKQYTLVWAFVLAAMLFFPVLLPVMRILRVLEAVNHLGFACTL